MLGSSWRARPQRAQPVGAAVHAAHSACGFSMIGITKPHVPQTWHLVIGAAIGFLSQDELGTRRAPASTVNVTE